MKKTVLKFGAIAALILMAWLVLLMPLSHTGTLSMNTQEVIGYATMVLAFLMVFLGIRSYRETVAGGSITFGRAFQVGILICLIGCVAYVVSWEIYYFNFGQDFLVRYSEHVARDMREAGASAAAVAAKTEEMKSFAKLYENPLFNIGVTFLEIFPVGLVMTLVSAGILRRKPSASEQTGAVAA
jgi:hypothetical protein